MDDGRACSAEDENEPELEETELSRLSFRDRGSAVNRDGRPASTKQKGAGGRGKFVRKQAGGLGGSARTPFSGLAVGLANGIVVGWQSRVLAGGECVVKAPLK